MTLLSLSFKLNTEDLRVAPSLQVARALLYSLAARVVGHDPIAGEAAARRLPEPKVVFDPYDALAGAHAAIVFTEWKEFRELDLKRVASFMNRPPLLVDGRNVLDSAAVGGAGIRYRGFERG